LEEEVPAQGATQFVEGAERPRLVSGPYGVALAKTGRRAFEGMVHQGLRHEYILLLLKIDVNVERM
jgi:hypothetical protein